ncbi:hypothetical protein ABTM87_19865, partial [Acinetobacter baumannii]
VFGLNTGYATWKARQLGGASTAASDLRVLSQQLANQGRDAVAGSAQAYAGFKETKARIDENVERLRTDFGNTPGVTDEVQQV